MPGSLNAHKRIEISDYDFDEVSKAPFRVDANAAAMISTHEYAVGAFVSGRIDPMPDGAVDFRRDLIRTGREWSHAAIEVIFSHWEREMALSPSEPLCPIGDQRIFMRDV